MRSHYSRAVSGATRKPGRGLRVSRSRAEARASGDRETAPSGYRLLALHALQFGHPAPEGAQPLFQLPLHLAHLLRLLADDAVLAGHYVDRFLELPLLLRDIGLRAVLGFQLLQDLLGVHHLLDLGQRHAQQVLELANVLHPRDVVLGVEPEAAVHAGGRTQQSLLLVEAQGPLRYAGPLGDFTDLEIRFLAVRHRPAAPYTIAVCCLNWSIARLYFYEIGR